MGKWSAQDSIVVVGGILVLLAVLIWFIWMDRPEERDAKPSVQPVQQQIEQWPQPRYIDDQEMRLRKLERDLWDRENERRMESLKFFGDK